MVDWPLCVCPWLRGATGMPRSLQKRIAWASSWALRQRATAAGRRCFQRPKSLSNGWRSASSKLMQSGSWALQFLERSSHLVVGHRHGFHRFSMLEPSRRSVGSGLLGCEGGLQAVVNREEGVELDDSQEASDALGRSDEDQAAAGLGEPAEIPHQFADTGRIHLVDLRHVDQHVAALLFEHAFERSREEDGALAELDDALDDEERVRSDAAFFDDHWGRWKRAQLSSDRRSRSTRAL